MPSTEALPTFSEVGGIFALLVLLHFLADWIPQSHTEAMRKSTNWRVRALHCVVYVVPFAVLMFLAGVDWQALAAMVVLLYVSHFIEDTYVPVFLWAKYLRRPPEMRWKVSNHGGFFHIIGPEQYVGKFPGPRELGVDSLPESLPPSLDSHAAGLLGEMARGETSVKEVQRGLDREGFKKFAADPLGKILVITVDQVIHVLFLVPVAVVLALSGG